MPRDGYYVVRTYTAGGVGEKTKFWVTGPRPSKLGRRQKTDIKKQETNETSAVKRLARLLNGNYSQGDYLVGLDYSDEGLKTVMKKARGDKILRCAQKDRGKCAQKDRGKYALDESGGASASGMSLDDELFDNAVRRAAESELRLCIERCNYELRKRGMTLMHVAVTSDMDGDTGEKVRVHHHLVIPREALDIVKSKWKHGSVDWKPLSQQDDYWELAKYLCDQVRRVPDEKKYMRSRNLKTPEPKDRIVYSDAELRFPRGAKPLLRTEYKPGRPQYIRYVLPKEDGEDGEGKILRCAQNDNVGGRNDRGGGGGVRSKRNKR